MKTNTMWIGVIALVLGAVGVAQAENNFGPSPYVQFNPDSPFSALSFGGIGEFFFLEDFEDGALNTPGVAASVGAVFGPGGNTDSVDEDDGLVDGSGTNGRSFLSGNGGQGITFTFNDVILGGFPTHVGIVWTDGNNNIGFEALDANGVPVDPPPLMGAHADGFIGGMTGEDRFYGAFDEIGIRQIVIFSGAGEIEVDHLQYGRAVSPAGIPAPAALPAGLILMGLLAARRRKHG